MKSSSSEGFNQWTVPWTAPDSPELSRLRHGEISVPEFDLDQDLIEQYQLDGVLYLDGAFTDWVETLRAGLARNLADPTAFRFPAERRGD